MNKESMSIRCAAAMESIPLDAALIAKKMKVSLPKTIIKKHSNPEMRAMLILEFSAALLRALSGRKDKEPKPQVDKHDGILAGMIVRDTTTTEYGKCVARYFVTGDKGDVAMLKISLRDVTGNRVERRVKSSNCEIMTEEMVKKAEKAARNLAEKEAKDKAEADKAAEKLNYKNIKQNADDEAARMANK